MRISGLRALQVAITAAWVLLLASQSVLAAGGGAAGPAELPPPEFPGGQYIDSAGCVFQRQSGDWHAREGRDGTPLCGYPPTLSARRTAPSDIPLQQAEVEDARTRITRELTEAVVTGMQAGELQMMSPLASGPDAGLVQGAVTQTAGASHTVAESPMAHAVAGSGTAGGSLGKAHDLAAEGGNLLSSIAAVPQARAAIATASAGDHVDQLCDLLGGQAATEGGFGGQAALGMCGQMDAIEIHGHAVRGAGGEGNGAPGQAAQAAITDQASNEHAGTTARTTTAVRGRTDHPARSSNAGKNLGRKPAQAVPAPDRAAAGMVPAGARFVQIGLFTNEANARRAVTHLTSMGLPVAVGSASAKGKPARAVMAGPFGSREDIVRALDKVRRGGFRDAYARR